ncbi:MAG: hypothetical protein AB1894_02520 [Chloroflexota bacterium]
MKIRSLILIGLIFLLIGCKPAVPSGPVNVATAAPVEALAMPDYTDAIFRKGLTDQAQAALDDLQGASIYTLDFTIADNYRSLEGHQAVLYTNQEDAPLAEIYLRLFPNAAGGRLTVSAVTVDQQPVRTVLESADSSLRVVLPASLQPGERALLELDFNEAIPSEGGGNFGIFGYLEDILVLDTFYPVIPVYRCLEPSRVLRESC